VSVFARHASLSAAALVAALGACERGNQPGPLTTRATLPAGVAAKVGPEDISVETVRRVAVAQKLEAREARDRAIYDALFAAGARERFAGTGRIKSVERSALARALMEQLLAEARALGGPTDAEITEITAERWPDLDRPASARTTHVVVRVGGAETKAKARALAERIADAVRGVRDPAEFKRRAEKLPRDGLEVLVQALPYTTPDGRVFVEENGVTAAVDQRFDAAFAAAATSIPEVGGQSPIVESSFGFHVILLEQRLPEKRVPLDERRSLLADDVIRRRATRKESEILAQSQASAPIEVSRALDELTGQLQGAR
jgi:hypothetical protein